jgi:uncharacterized protein (TIGR01777 family)
VTRRKVVIAGGSGFIGRSLVAALRDAEYEVVILSRNPQGDSAGVRAAAWDGRTIGPWAREVDGAEAVVNLAGKNVNCRYTRKNLDEIDQSRIDAVRVMGEAIARCEKPPAVLIQASTTAIYGDAGERWCDESTPPGEGIPPRTATKWETAFAASPTPHTRRVVLRISFVLGPGGGVLRMLTMLTRCFLGGRVGSGRQYVSWIHQRDLNGVILRAIDDERMSGTYNVATRNPVTNAELMHALRRVHRRPWSPPVPAWAVRLGCFALRTEPVLALTGRRAAVGRLLETGFSFEFPELDSAINDVSANRRGGKFR